MAIEWKRGGCCCCSFAEVGCVDVRTQMLPSGQFAWRVVDDDGDGGDVFYGVAASREEAEAKAERDARHYFFTLIGEGEAGLRALGVSDD